MLKRKKDTSELQIVSIDPISLESYVTNDNIIEAFNLNKASHKRDFYISYLYTKDIISGIVDVSRRLEEDEISEAIEIEAYETLGLDGASEYKLTHIETQTTDSKNKSFNVFAFDSNSIFNTFKNVTQKTKYIDYITAAPFLFESLYIKKILEPESIDCFIYFQKQDAFITIYQGGKYLYSKPLNYSLTTINEKFCELIGERIDENEFYRALSNKGIKKLSDKFSKLYELFEEIFTYLLDIIIFFKRSYNIDIVNKIFIGSEIGPIDGLVELAQYYLGIQSQELLFSVVRNKNDQYIDQMHILMLLSAQEYLESKEENYNLTIFKRPPSFEKRPSGMLTIGSLLALFGALAYPTYQYVHGFYLHLDSKNKQIKYDEAHKIATNLRETLAKLDRAYNEVLKEADDANKKLQFRNNLLNEINDKKVHYPMKAVILNDLVKLINDKSIKISHFIAQDKNTTITLRSHDDKRLTELLTSISNTNKFKVNTKEIVKNEEIGMYESNVTTRIIK